LPKELTPAERQALKGRAHRLKPVVLVGEDGLSPAVAGEIERALTVHELIKIRVTGAERAAREALFAEVCAITGAAPVQHIGKVLVVFRARPPEAATTAVAPAVPPRRAARPARRASRATPRRARIRSR
jgi:putative YhbY family RNA-binding protein